MPNRIDYAAVFNQILDEKFYVLPRTAWMENSTPGLVWTGGKEIKIPKLKVDGLGDMQGYKAPDGDMVLEYETKILQWYRGRNFTIGRYDVDMSNFALTVGNALKVFLNGEVIPEIDCLRIAKAAQGAMSYGKVTVQATSEITTANILDLIMADIASVQDKIGENEQLYIQIATGLKSLLARSTQISRYLDVKDLQIREAVLQIQALDGQYLIGTPSGYMHSVFGLNDGRTSGQTVGGVSFTNLGPNVNWIIAARPAVDAIARPQITKVIDPDTNQEAEAWKIMFSLFHGDWIMENKGDGLLANINNALGSFTVTSTAGEAAEGVGATTIGTTAVVPDDFILVYKTDASTAPTVAAGTALTAANGWNQLPANGKLTVTNGYKITVAAVSAASRQPVASGNATVASYHT